MRLFFGIMTVGSDDINVCDELGLVFRIACFSNNSFVAGNPLLALANKTRFGIMWCANRVLVGLFLENYFGIRLCAVLYFTLLRENLT